MRNLGLLWAIAWTASACGSSRRTVDADADSDTDTDVDGDTDADTDTGTGETLDAGPEPDAGGDPCEGDECPGTCEAHFRLDVGVRLEADTCGGENLYRNCFNDEGGPEIVAVFVPPVTGRYRFDTRGSDIDTTLGVSETCGQTDLACNDDFPAEEYLLRTDSTIIVDLESGHAYFLVVDAAFDDCGPVALTATAPAAECLEIDPCKSHDDCCSGVCDVLCLYPDQ